MTINMHTWQTLKKEYDLGVPGSSGTGWNIMHPFQSLPPHAGIAGVAGGLLAGPVGAVAGTALGAAAGHGTRQPETSGMPGPDQEWAEDTWGPGTGHMPATTVYEPGDARTPVQQFQDQGTYSQLWQQQQAHLKQLAADKRPLPPSMAEHLPEGTTPQDLIRERGNLAGVAPPWKFLGEHAGPNQPFTLHTTGGAMDIKGPLGSRFGDTANWLAGAAKWLPGTAASEERKYNANQAAIVGSAMRNMLQRGRNNPNYWGNEQDHKILSAAMKTDLLPRMGFDDKETKWIMRTIGGGQQALRAEQDKAKSRAYKEARADLRAETKDASPFDVFTVTKLRELSAGLGYDVSKLPRFDGKKGTPRKQEVMAFMDCEGDIGEYNKRVAAFQGGIPGASLTDAEFTARVAASTRQLVIEAGGDPDDEETMRDTLLAQLKQTEAEGGDPHMLQRLRAMDDDDMDPSLRALMRTAPENQRMSPEDWEKQKGQWMEDIVFSGEIAAPGSVRSTNISEAMDAAYKTPNPNWSPKLLEGTVKEFVSNHRVVRGLKKGTRGAILRILDAAENPDSEHNEAARNHLQAMVAMLSASSGYTREGEPGFATLDEFDDPLYQKSERLTGDPLDLAWGILKTGW